MDLRQIRQFLAVAELLSFRKAAERLHMSQPPLSVSIKQLEQDLGVQLFERDRSGVSLTPAGRAILDEARQLDQSARHLRERAASARLGLSGLLRVGFVGSATYALMPRMLPVFRSSYPDVTLELRESTTSGILAEVDAGSLDLGLLRYPVLEKTGLLLIPVEWDRMVLVLEKSHPLCRRDTIHLRDLAEEPFIMYSSTVAHNLRAQVVLACQAAGFMPQVVQEAVQIQTIVSLVASGLGIALVPSISRHYSPPNVVFKTVTDRGGLLKVAIAIAIGRNRASPAAQEFRRFLEKRMEQAE
jgi:DNA-binding transcriptional LysR family regulator